MASPIARLHRVRSEPVVRQPHPRARDRRPATTLIARARHPRRHVEPDDLREGDGGGHRLRRAAARGHRRPARRPKTRTGSSSPPTSRDAADLLRPDVRRARRPRRLRLGRGVARTSRTTPTGTIAQAKELWARLGRPNVMIKIPATRGGIPAITAALAAGLNVNVTLIFSLERYREVIEAFLAGLEQRVARGERRRAHRVGRVVLRQPGRHRDRPPAARGPRRCGARPRSPTPSSRTSCSSSGSRVRAGTRSRRRARGVQRPLWASTSTKNPAYSPTLYVDKLIGRDTVNTLAQASIDVLAHGRRRSARRHRAARASTTRARSMAGLAEAGVDFDDVTATLEREGVDVVRAVVPRRARHAREEGARADSQRRRCGRIARSCTTRKCSTKSAGLACAFRPLVFGITYAGAPPNRLGLPAEPRALRSTATR